MCDTTIEKLNPASYLHQNAVKDIMIWSVAAPMITLTEESIATHSFSAIALDANGLAAGYAALSVQYEDGVGEFGGLIVKPKQYNGELAADLTAFVVHSAVKDLSLNTVIAFAHKKSWKVFEKLGGIVIGQRGEISKPEWAAYAATGPEAINFIPQSDHQRDAVVDLSGILRK
jgi:N-acetylglutamate synthase-like GNAT family acetyltransferase